MKNEQFNEIVKDQLDRVEAMLIQKGAEYATDRDRLHNFKQAAALQNLSPHDALGGMMIKHTVSIYDMIGDNTGTHSMEKWDEKITDHITYLVLLKAVIEEEEAERIEALHPMIHTTVEPTTIEGNRFKSNVTFGSDIPTELMTTTDPSKDSN